MMFRIQVAFSDAWTDWDSFDDREAALEEIASLAADPALARVRLCLDADGALEELLLVEGGKVVEPEAPAAPAEPEPAPESVSQAAPGLAPSASADSAPAAAPPAFDAAGRRLSHPLDGLAQPYGAAPPLEQAESGADAAAPDEAEAERVEAVPPAFSEPAVAAHADDEPLDLTPTARVADPAPPAVESQPGPSPVAETPPAPEADAVVETPPTPEPVQVAAEPVLDLPASATVPAPEPEPGPEREPEPESEAEPEPEPVTEQASVPEPDAKPAPMTAEAALLAVLDPVAASAATSTPPPADKAGGEPSDKAEIEGEVATAPESDNADGDKPESAVKEDVTVMEELASLLHDDKFIAREKGDGKGPAAAQGGAPAEEAGDDEKAEGDDSGAPKQEAAPSPPPAATPQQGQQPQGGGQGGAPGGGRPGGPPGGGRPQPGGAQDDAPDAAEGPWRRRASSLAVTVAAAAAVVSVGLFLKDALPYLNITGGLPNVVEQWPFGGDDGGTDLMSAIRERDRTVVSDLLSRGAAAQTSGIGDELPLLAAARAGDTEIMRMLLDHGADFRAPAPPYSSLFAQVSAEGLIAATGLFLEEGANPDVAAKPGTCRTPLMEAVDRRNRRLATLLVHNGASLAPLPGCNEGVADLPGVDSTLLARLQEIELARGRFPSSQAVMTPSGGTAGGTDRQSPAAYRNVMFGLSWDDSFQKLRRMAQSCDRGEGSTISCRIPMATWLGDISEVELVFDEADENRLVSIRAASRAIEDGSRAGTGDGAQATFRRVKAMIQDRLPPDHPRFEVEDAPVGMPFWEGLRPEVKGGEFYAYWSDDNGRRPVSIYLALVGTEERAGYYRISIENPSTRW